MLSFNTPVALLLFASVFALAAAPPNIVLIVADDLGYGDLACYGSKTSNTPHIDALAASGLRFTDFHSAGAMCTPTRAAMLTGVYQQRLGP
ncbi:MAG: arylsulfatase A, partial [Rhodothermales bacterium]